MVGALQYISKECIECNCEKIVEGKYCAGGECPFVDPPAEMEVELQDTEADF